MSFHKTYKFMAKLISGQMNGPKRTTANLLLYEVLVYTMFGGAVITAVAIFGSRIERFLMAVSD